MRTLAIFFLTLSLIVCATSQAKPVKDLPKRDVKPVKEWPKLPQNTNWGTCIQVDDSVVISGHPVWSAEGYFRKDGKLYLTWTLLSDGRVCPGLYDIKVPLLGHAVPSGQWGYEDEGVIVDPNGGISGGSLHSDHIYEIQLPKKEEQE